jgi:uncharacterized protein YbjT (DUF2867 family)
MTAPVAVLGAGGKTARSVLAALARSAQTARPLARADADLDSGAGLVAGLTGCRATWLAVPNMHPDEPGVVARVLAAARAAGVPRIIYHSVAWPYAPSMPHHLGKAVGEDLVRRSGMTFTILQPCVYLQNLMPAIASGRIEVPYSLDARFAFVDLDDVAEATAVVLADTSGAHDGATYELGGPELLSVQDLTALAGSISGSPISAVRISLNEWIRGPGSALDDARRAGLIAMFETYDAHGLPAGHLATNALLGRPANPATSVLER